MFSCGVSSFCALLLADNIWGAEKLPKDGKYGPRGDRALKWLNDRVESIATRGSGEFASRPYFIYNVSTLRTLGLPLAAALAHNMAAALLLAVLLSIPVLVRSPRLSPAL